MKGKQVIVFRRDLLESMGIEKIAVCVSQASMSAFMKCFNTEKVMPVQGSFIGLYEPEQYYTRYILEVYNDTMLDDWIKGGLMKTVVCVDNEEELLKIRNRLEGRNEEYLTGIPYALVKDPDNDTNVCIGIGPYSPGEIDKITGNLQLL